MQVQGLLKKRSEKPNIAESSSDEERKNQNDKSNLPLNKTTLEENNFGLLDRPKTHIKTLKKDKKKKIINESTIINISDLAPINSERIKITHNIKSEKKRLDNSFEDYFFCEIVDDESFQKFLIYSQNYISNRLNDKIQRLYSSLRRQITESIQHGLKDIHLHTDLINKVISRSVEQEPEKKGVFQKMCKCFSKPKMKNHLIEYHNMPEVSMNIENEINNFGIELRNEFSDKKIEEICVLPHNETEEFTQEKAKKFLHKKAIEERLREEVENYSKYFNIDIIIEKQENTLKSQAKKIEKLNETKELNVCIICMEHQRNIMFYPCFHVIVCEDCSKNKVKDICPECKKKIQSKTVIS